MTHPDLRATCARAQYQDRARDAARRRLAAQSGQGQLTPSRRAARALGRALLRLGAALLRYGLADPPTTRPYRPSVHSIELN
jgi:hypothetical protein